MNPKKLAVNLEKFRVNIILLTYTDRLIHRIGSRKYQNMSSVSPLICDLGSIMNEIKFHIHVTEKYLIMMWAPTFLQAKGQKHYWAR
jgi:hypothetical protein